MSGHHDDSEGHDRRPDVDESERARRDLANAHRGEVVEGSGVAIEPRELPAVGAGGSNLGVDDRRPAAEAGRADGDGGDVYEAPAQAMSAKVAETTVAGVIAASPEFRAAIDAARAPLLAELAEVTRERDEARAKAVDGGEWTTVYGDSDPSESDRTRAIEWCDMPGCDNEEREHDRQRRVWLGPVEPVTDDESGT